MDSGEHKTYYPCGLSLPNANTSFAYLFWMANNKNENIQSSVCDKIWYEGSGGHKYYPCDLSSQIETYLIPHLHISVLIG